MKIFTKDHMVYNITRREIRRAKLLCGRYNTFMRPDTRYVSHCDAFRLHPIEEKMLLDLILATYPSSWESGRYVMHHKGLDLHVWMGNGRQFVSIHNPVPIALRKGTQGKLWDFLLYGKLSKRKYRDGILSKAWIRIKEVLFGGTDNEVVGQFYEYQTPGFLKLIEHMRGRRGFGGGCMVIFVISRLIEGKLSNP